MKAQPQLRAHLIQSIQICSNLSINRTKQTNRWKDDARQPRSMMTQINYQRQLSSRGILQSFNSLRHGGSRGCATMQMLLWHNRFVDMCDLHAHTDRWLRQNAKGVPVSCKASTAYTMVAAQAVRQCKCCSGTTGLLTCATCTHTQTVGCALTSCSATQKSLQNHKA